VCRLHVNSLGAFAHWRKAPVTFVIPVRLSVRFFPLGSQWTDLLQIWFWRLLLRCLWNSWFQTFAVYWMLCAFFWVIPRRLNFICRRFRTLCLFHLHRQVGACRMNHSTSTYLHLHRQVGACRMNHSTRTYLPMKMEQIVPKRRHIKFRRRGITQKKAYNMCRENPNLVKIGCKYRAHHVKS